MDKKNEKPVVEKKNEKPAKGKVKIKTSIRGGSYHTQS
jgi:hypothetical protein